MITEEERGMIIFAFYDDHLIVIYDVMDKKKAGTPLRASCNSQPEGEHCLKLDILR